MKKITAVVVLALGLMALAGSALAHEDGGVDEAFITPDMNQASYWEDRFDAECTKYENHPGTIPDWVDIAIVHDGQFVRVYNPAPSFVLGPHNPNNGKHFGAPHSWVMKCTVDDTQETTTTTTTTRPEETTTTTEQVTTTTEQDTTTTTAGATTSTTAQVTTTTLPALPEDTPPILPFTGIQDWLPPLGAIAVASGSALLYISRRRQETK